MIQSVPLVMEWPRELHKKVTNLSFGSSGVVRSLEDETDIQHLSEVGYHCWSGITKCENTAQPTEGVDPDLNIACCVVVKRLKEYNAAYLANWLMGGPTPSSEAALDAAETALMVPLAVVEDFDTTNVNIQVVFTREIRVVEVPKKKRSKEQQSPTQTDGSDSDDQVADPSLDKRAKTSKTDQAPPLVRL